VVLGERALGYFHNYVLARTAHPAVAGHATRLGFTSNCIMYIDAGGWPWLPFALNP